MSDGQILNKTGRAVVSISILVFAVLMIIWLVRSGSPDNSLHKDALSWAYTLVLLMIAALVSDAVVGALVPLLKKPEL